jgi:ribose-phosphate pyrophosphokinase
MEYTLFNGGEVNLRLPENFLGNPEVGSVIVDAWLQSSDDIIALCMLTDALKREYPVAKYQLLINYIPYARQDRVCNEGEALSIKVFANIINTLSFDSVALIDPHSEVAGAVLDNVTRVVTQDEIIQTSPVLATKLSEKGVILISPDAGATKKTETVSKAFGGVPVVQGYKQRDLATGALSGFGVSDPEGLLHQADCLIVDDICDGGGTFLGLAAELRKAGAQTVSLYVTHGIFSQGIEKLLDNGIDRVYTTDSFLSGEQHERLEVIKL